MPEESTTPDLAERMERTVEAFNAGDFDLAASMYAPDALFYPRAAVCDGLYTVRECQICRVEHVSDHDRALEAAGPEA